MSLFLGCDWPVLLFTVVVMAYHVCVTVVWRPDHPKRPLFLRRGRLGSGLQTSVTGTRRASSAGGLSLNNGMGYPG